MYALSMATQKPHPPPLPPFNVLVFTVYSVVLARLKCFEEWMYCYSVTPGKKVKIILLAMETNEEFVVH